MTNNNKILDKLLQLVQGNNWLSLIPISNDKVLVYIKDRNLRIPVYNKISELNPEGLQLVKAGIIVKLDTDIQDVDLIEGKKKKNKPYSSVTYTTGDPKLNIAHFNKMLTGQEDSNHTNGYLNGTFKNTQAEASASAKAIGTFASASPDGASSISMGGADSGSSDGGGMGEGLELQKTNLQLQEEKIEEAFYDWMY